VISENGLPGPVLALQRTTHCTLHALGSALSDLNLGAAEINALANLADRGALNVRELSAETGTRALLGAAIGCKASPKFPPVIREGGRLPGFSGGCGEVC